MTCGQAFRGAVRDSRPVAVLRTSRSFFLVNYSVSQKVEIMQRDIVRASQVSRGHPNQQMLSSHAAFWHQVLLLLFMPTNVRCEVSGSDFSAPKI